MKLRLSKAFYSKHGTAPSPSPPTPYPLNPLKALVGNFPGTGNFGWKDGKIQTQSNS